MITVSTLACCVVGEIKFRGKGVDKEKLSMLHIFLHMRPSFTNWFYHQALTDGKTEGSTVSVLFSVCVCGYLGWVAKLSSIIYFVPQKGIRM
jgi:hypothetical protein